MRFSEDEYAAFASAARGQELSDGAYGAQVCMAHVQGLDSVEQEVMRDLLKTLMLTAVQVRKIGVLFDQAATKENTAGWQVERFVAYAVAADRTLRRVDELAARVRACLP